VDDAEAARLAQADNLRFPDKPSVADVDCLNQVLRVLSTDLARIGSSAALLGPTAHRTFQHRVAADFVQAQAWRAAWIANAAAVIVNQARPGRAATIASIVERVRTGFEPEMRLTRLQLECTVSPAAAGVALDEEVGTTALTSCIFATLAWLDGADDARIEVRADAPNPRALKVEVVQRTAIVPAEAARYLREAGQVPPAELTIALGLLAARCLATQNGGGVELTPIAGGGSIIQSTFSKPTAN
jgi:hypothetical protein